MYLKIPQEKRFICILPNLKSFYILYVYEEYMKYITEILYLNLPITYIHI